MGDKKMKKKLVYILLFILLISLVKAECDTTDIKQAIFEDGQATRKDLDDAEKNFNSATLNIIQTEGQELLNAFNQTLRENIKLTIFYVSLSLFGILLLVNGIIGYIRLKKESELLFIIADMEKGTKNKLNEIEEMIKRKGK